MHLSPAAGRACAIVLAVWGTGAAAEAAGVVGNGTPASCTEAALNTALVGGGAVTFNCGGGPVVIPVTSTKTLTTTTTIDGTGQDVTLDGLNTTQLFRTTFQSSAFTLTFRRLTLRNGRSPDYGGAIRLAFSAPATPTSLVIENALFQGNVCDAAGNDVGGGAVYAQGGIVTIRNSAFVNNRGGNGGALGNLQARFTIEDTTFEGNVTNAATGQFGGVGGAIYIDGSGGGQLVIRRSRFTANVATRTAGAIHTYLYAGGTGMTIEDTTFDGNRADQNGGAVYHQNGALTIARSTFANNTTRGQGGGIWLLQASPTTITNSTFTGNSATGIPPNAGSSGLGGAILINQFNTVTISHTTIANNHADWVGGGITGGMNQSTTTLRGTVIANNTAANGGNPWNIAHNCSTQLLDGGGNLQFPARINPGDPNDPNCTGVIAIGDPLLAPLASNGGYTATRALGAGSPARDRVTSGCPPPATDQRGVSRPQGQGCDAGAYEAAPVVSAADVSVEEGTGGMSKVVFSVTLSEANTLRVTVAFQTAAGTAAAGADFIPASGTLTFPAGTTLRTPVVEVVADAIDEDDETFTLVLSSPVNASLGGGGTATATLQDDDAPPAVSALDCMSLEGTASGGSCAMTVSLSAASGKQVRVSFATQDGTAMAPLDYAAASGTITFPPGVQSLTHPAALAADAQDEADETFVFNLSNVQNATVADAQGLVTIDDDDGPSLSLSSPSVSEGNAGTTQAGFALSLSAPSPQSVVVTYLTSDGTASSGGDYVQTSGTVTFPAGTTGQSVNVPVIGDVVDEPNETFYLNLGSVTDATPAASAALGTIRDDDGAAFPLLTLDHGTDRRETLQGGPDVYVVQQGGRTSWEVRVDGASGDLGNGNGPSLERLAAGFTVVLQSSSAIGAGPARTLRWTNPVGTPQDHYVRVSSATCGTGCGPDDVYRLRAYETTGRIARFNATGGQVTIVVLHNPTSAPIAVSAFFWSPSGALLDTRTASIPARSLLTFDSSSVPGAAGQAGSITVAHDGGYGALVGKAVSLDPAAGFSFDTLLTYRPR